MKSTLHLLRYVDRKSVMHRANSRTKIAGLSALAISLVINPGWLTVATIWGLGVLFFIAARLPLGTLPRPPKLILWGIAASFFLALLSGGEPNLTILGFTFGAQGLIIQSRFIAVSLGLLFLTLLVGWTTPPAELPGAIEFILRPLRLLRIPIDGVITGLALAVRVLPLLIDELTTTLELWRMRDQQRSADSKNRDRIDEALDIATTSTTSAIRRSLELGVALQARGTTQAPIIRSSWSLADIPVGLAVAAAVSIIFIYN